VKKVIFSFFVFVSLCSSQTIETNEASSIGVTFATLSGYVSAPGDYITCTMYFEYGTTAGLGSVSDTTSGWGLSGYSGNVNIRVWKLKPNTEYFYRIVCYMTWGIGTFNESTGRGSIASFKTNSVLFQSIVPQNGTNNVDSLPNIQLYCEPLISGQIRLDTTFFVFGSFTGFRRGNLSVDTANGRVMFVPGEPFLPHENVGVLLTKLRENFSDSAFLPDYAWTFQIRSTSGTGMFTRQTGPNGLIADLNRDGLVDIVQWVPNMFLGDSIFLSNGDHTFSPKAFLYCHHDICDPNRDGYLDFNINGGCWIGSGTYVNDHTGNFSLQPSVTSTSIDTFATNILSSGWYDFNNDGTLDQLVWGNTGWTCYVSLVLPNNVTEIIDLAQKSEISSVHAADFNKDGNLDIAVAYDEAYNKRFFRIFVNDGTGHFPTTKDIYVPDTVADGLIDGILVGDFNGDGNEDVISRSNLFLGDGRGNFVWQKTNSDIPTRNPYDLQNGYNWNGPLADFDGDGALDIMTGGYLLFNRKPQASLKLDNKKVDFGMVRVDSIATGLFHITNGGGRDTLHLSFSSSNKRLTFKPATAALSPTDTLIFSVFYQPDSSIAFQDSVLILGPDSMLLSSITVLAIGDPIRSITPAPGGTVSPSLSDLVLEFQDDINSSSLKGNIFVTSSLSGFHVCSYAYNDVQRTLSIIPSRQFLPGEQVTLVLRDSILNLQKRTLVVPRTFTFKVSVGQSNGQFIETKAIKPLAQCYSLAAADLNNDCKVDFVAGTDSGFEVYRNTDHFQFVRAFSYTVGRVLSVALADFDNDGLIDIAVSPYNGIVYIFKNLGDFNFSLQNVEYADAWRLSAFDMNQDGYIDLGAYSTSNVSSPGQVITNSGKFQWNVIQQSFVHNIDAWNSHGDLNGDGLDDDVLYNTNGSVTIRINSINITYHDTTLSIKTIPIASALADLDRDGVLDVILGADSIYFFRNLPTEAIVGLTTRSIHFPLVAVNDTSTFLLPVSNRGSDTLRIDSLKIFNPREFNVSCDTFLVKPLHTVNVKVTFHPREFGNPKDSLMLSTSVGTFYVVVTGSSPYPVLTATQPSLSFGEVARNGTKQIGFKITNSSINRLAIDSIYTKTSIFKADKISGSVGGDTLSLGVKFAATTVGSFLDTLYLRNNSLISLVKIPLSGSIPMPVLAVSDTLEQFADKAKGDSVSRIIGIFNKSISPLTVNGISFGTAAFAVDTASVNPGTSMLLGNTIKNPMTMNRNKSKNISKINRIGKAIATQIIIPIVVVDTMNFRIWFKPGGFGSFADTLSIVSDGGSKKIPVSGNSPYPNLVCNATQIDFGAVGVFDSVKTTLRLTNSSVNALVIDTAYTSTSSFFISFNKDSINAGDTVSATVSFSTIRSGNFIDTLVIKDNAAIPTFRIPLKAFTPPAAIVVNRQKLSFGKVIRDSSSPLAISIADTSISRLSIDSLLTGTKYFTVSKTLADRFLRKGDTITTSIRFQPDTLRAYSDTLYIYNSSLVSPFKISLAGNGVLTSVMQASSLIPDHYFISQNFPDPFNPSTTIEYGLAMNSHVRLQIFNILGQRIATLYDGEQSAGYQKIQWNASVASGIYFYRIEATSVNDPGKHFMDTKKMLLLK